MTSRSSIVSVLDEPSLGSESMPPPKGAPESVLIYAALRYSASVMSLTATTTSKLACAPGASSFGSATTHSTTPVEPTPGSEVAAGSEDT